MSSPPFFRTEAGDGLTSSKTPRYPLGFAAFRPLWLATIVSNIGTWMHDDRAGWLMTSLSSDPLVVAIAQASTTLPMFVFALPAVPWPISLIAGVSLDAVRAAQSLNALSGGSLASGSIGNLESQVGVMPRLGLRLFAGAPYGASGDVY